MCKLNVKVEWEAVRNGEAKKEGKIEFGMESQPRIDSNQVSPWTGFQGFKRRLVILILILKLIGCSVGLYHEITEKVMDPKPVVMQLVKLAMNPLQ